MKTLRIPKPEFRVSQNVQAPDGHVRKIARIEFAFWWYALEGDKEAEYCDADFRLVPGRKRRARRRGGLPFSLSKVEQPQKKHSGKFCPGLSR